jgi:DinB superfamily
MKIKESQMSDNPFRRPNADEYFEYYANYINQVLDGDFFQMFENQVGELKTFFATVTEKEASVLHAPYTWTIKQVVGHLIDAERIFANRLHRFACGDLQPLAGMEQDPYVENSDYEKPTLKSLLDELLLLRQANILLLRRVKPSAWDNRGVASNHPITVRALAYILIGHINHHMRIFRKRLAK